MKRFGTLAAMTLLLVAHAGCAPGGSDQNGGAPRAIPEPDDLLGIYAGRFPCSNCAAIETTLWLRPDGRFVLRQRYALADGAADSASYALGRWRWDETSGQLVLAGTGPDRRFAPVAPDSLEMQTVSPLPHTLTRDAAATPLDDSFRLEGESAVGERGITFTECITGLVLEVGPGGGYEELLRQHRRLNRNGPAALTEVEAHLHSIETPEGTTRELLVVDRFLGLKPRTGCR